MSSKDKTNNNEASKTEAISENKTKNNVDVRAGKLKLFSISSFVILLVIVLALNIIFSLKINNTSIDDYLTYDMSSTGQNSISDISVSYIDSLPADTTIRIVGLFDRPTNLKDTPYEYIVPLLDDYVSKSSGKVTVEYINPTKYPSIISELDPNGVYDLASSNNYVVYVNGKIIEINPVDCFTYDPEMLQYGYYLPTSNIVEQKFTSAIVNLTQGYTYTAYFVTGLGEDSHTQLSNMLSSMSIGSEQIMASDNFVIPSDCSLLILSGINTDITDSMSSAIKDYLSSGGKIIVSVNFFSTNVSESFPKLNLLLSNYNICIQNALLIENNPGYQINNDSYNTLIDVNSDLIEYTGGATTLRNSYARPVTAADSPYNYVQVTPLFATSTNASICTYDPATDNLIQNVVQGQYSVGMYATFTGTPTPPDVYVFGTTTFTSDDYINNFGFNDANIVFTRNIIRGMLKADDSVFVEGKPLSDYSIKTEYANSNTATVLTFVLVAILPLGLIIAGVVVYNKRKNL
ncbi:MAG: Gldg family protein [Clostridiales bacterium]|nr:Gldg family protein [Clostridiales bacterium]